MHAGHGSGTKSQHLRCWRWLCPLGFDPAVHMNVAALRRKVASHSRVDKQQLQLAWFEPILAELACHGCEDPSCSCLGPELGHCIAVVVVFLQRRAIRVKSLFTLPFQPLVGQALSQAERSGRVPTRVLGRYTLWVSGSG